MLLNLEKATLELFDEPQAEWVDGLEVGERVSGPVRFAFEVPDLKEAARIFQEAGAQVVNQPVLTPWGDYNQRLQIPGGLQITLYEARKTEEPVS